MTLKTEPTATALNVTSANSPFVSLEERLGSTEQEREDGDRTEGDQHQRDETDRDPGDFLFVVRVSGRVRLVQRRVADSEDDSDDRQRLQVVHVSRERPDLFGDHERTASRNPPTICWAESASRSPADGAAGEAS